MGSFWDRWAFAYDLAEQTNGRAVRGMIRAVAALTPDQGRVLECAAGTGAISAAVAPRAQSVLCTDQSLPMLDRARRKAERQSLTNVAFAQRDLLHLSDQDDSYDMTVAANVLHLLPEPQAAVRELWRVTRPGGLVVLPTFLQGEAGPGFRLALGLYRLIGFHPEYRFTLEQYEAMVNGCGLGRARLDRIEGRLPVGLAVLRK